MKRKIFLSMIATVLLALSSEAQIYYDFTAATPSGVPTGWTSSALTINDTRVGCTDCGSRSSSNISSGYAGASGGNNQSITSVTTTATSYYEFVITPSASQKVIINNIGFGARSTTAGPNNLIVRSSIDSYGSDLATISLTRNGIWELKSSPVIIDGGINGSAVTIRFYVSGTVGSSTPSLRLDDLILSGPSPLPVNLISFNGKKQAEGIQLNWVTASEENNSHFDIHRSADGKKFQFVGKENGKGNSDNEVNYSFADLNPLGGTNYYQLSQVDFDGKVTPSEIIAVESGLDETSLNVITKQGSNEVEVNIYSANSTSANLSFYDIAGTSLNRTTIKLVKGYNQIKVPLNLSAGIFFTTLTTPTYSISKKFVK